MFKERRKSKNNDNRETIPPASPSSSPRLRAVVVKRRNLEKNVERKHRMKETSKTPSRRRRRRRPPRLRAVVATALVSQTRGSLAFLGFGERTLVSTLGDAACPVCASKGVVKTTAPGVAGAVSLHARRNSNITSFCESVRSETTRRRRTRRPSSSRLFRLRKVGDGSFVFVFLSVLGLLD